MKVLDVVILGGSCRMFGFDVVCCRISLWDLFYLFFLVLFFFFGVCRAPYKF